MDEIPAPFLNRFEKYRLTLQDILVSGWSRLGSLMQVIEQSHKQTTRLAMTLHGRSGALGWMDRRETIDSLFIDLLPGIDGQIWARRHDSPEVFSSTATRIDAILVDFLSQYTDLPDASDHALNAIRSAREVLPADNEISVGAHKLVSGEISNADVVTCLQSMTQPKHAISSLSNLLRALLQMAVTRATTFRLIQVATPEAIFSNR